MDQDGSSREMCQRTLYINNLNERIPHKILNNELTKLCRQYGPVVSVSTGRSLRKRGQAFVAFKERDNAATALENLLNVQMFNKPLRVSYARSESFGNVDEEQLAERRRRRQHTPEKEKSDSRTGTPAPTAPPAAAVTPPPNNVSFGEPHNVLLLQQIPTHITLPDLQQLCMKFAGFVEARMFAVKHVGFIDFDSVANAEAAIPEIATMGLGNVTYAKK